ncbi:MAG: response regulator [Fibrobacter sp.]|nr:response regulator [Fibrobacter sp.]
MKSRKIMVIDNDPAISELLKVNLAARGHEVIAYTNGKDALNDVFEVKPNLVILDVVLPEIDGWEILKIIKDHSHGADIKVMLLTARNSMRDKLIGRVILKADAYVTKPFDLNELLSIIGKLLEDKK